MKENRCLTAYCRPPHSDSATIRGMSDSTETMGNGGSHDDAWRIGDYEILRVLGRGGQGTVYLARDPRLGRRVALKVLTGLGATSPELLARFKREAELASRLEHPGICAIHEAGVVEDTPFIAMRYLEGETLSERIAKFGAREIPSLVSFIDLENDDDREDATVVTDRAAKDVSRTTKIEIRRAARLVERVARALHSAHEQGIIHRDVKPGNIFVTPEGDPIVLDFGLARDLDEELAELTRTGDVFGTPAYMSPEQIQGRHERIDRRTDIWALGVVLYECLTGEKPFCTTTREGLYQAILKEEIPDPSRLNPSISRDLRAILETAIEKRLVRRYQTAEALADDLHRFLEHEPVAARRAGPLQRAVRWTLRYPVVSAATAVVIVMLGLGLVWSARKNEELSESEGRVRNEARFAEEARAATQKRNEELVASRRRETEARDAADAERRRADMNAYVSILGDARYLIETGRRAEAQRRAVVGTSALGLEISTAFEWRYVLSHIEQGFGITRMSRAGEIRVPLPGSDLLVGFAHDLVRIEDPFFNRGPRKRRRELGDRPIVAAAIDETAELGLEVEEDGAFRLRSMDDLEELDRFPPAGAQPGKLLQVALDAAADHAVLTYQRDSKVGNRVVVTSVLRSIDDGSVVRTTDHTLRRVEDGMLDRTGQWFVFVDAAGRLTWFDTRTGSAATRSRTFADQAVFGGISRDLSAYMWDPGAEELCVTSRDGKERRISGIGRGGVASSSGARRSGGSRFAPYPAECMVSGDGSLVAVGPVQTSPLDRPVIVHEVETGRVVNELQTVWRLPDQAAWTPHNDAGRGPRSLRWDLLDREGWSDLPARPFTVSWSRDGKVADLAFLGRGFMLLVGDEAIAKDDADLRVHSCANGARLPPEAFEDIRQGLDRVLSERREPAAKGMFVEGQAEEGARGVMRPAIQSADGHRALFWRKSIQLQRPDGEVLWTKDSPPLDPRDEGRPDTDGSLGPVTRVVFGKDGRALHAGYRHGGVIWSLDDGKVLARVDFSGNWAGFDVGGEPLRWYVPDGTGITIIDPWSATVLMRLEGARQSLGRCWVEPKGKAVFGRSSDQRRLFAWVPQDEGSREALRKARVVFARVRKILLDGVDAADDAKELRAHLIALEAERKTSIVILTEAQRLLDRLGDEQGLAETLWREAWDIVSGPGATPDRADFARRAGRLFRLVLDRHPRGLILESLARWRLGERSDEITANLQKAVNRAGDDRIWGPCATAAHTLVRQESMPLDQFERTLDSIARRSRDPNLAPLLSELHRILSARR